MFRLRGVSGVLGCLAFLVVVAHAQAQAQPPVAKPQPPPPVAGAAQPQQASPAKPPSAAPTPGAPPQQSIPAKPVAPPPAAPAQPPVTPQPKAQPPAGATADTPPTDAQLGVRVYPGATFIGSYDAGRGQRFYLFGTLQPFAEMVTFYKNELKDKGELVFDAPPTHMFDVGKFREDTMAFPPSVTIKDYRWGGSAGYLNPRPGATPPAFLTVIQIVAAPAVLAGPIR